jgi:hypothetical protein
MFDYNFKKFKKNIFFIFILICFICFVNNINKTCNNLINIHKNNLVIIKEKRKMLNNKNNYIKLKNSNDKIMLLINNIKKSKNIIDFIVENKKYMFFKKFKIINKCMKRNNIIISRIKYYNNKVNINIIYKKLNKSNIHNFIFDLKKNKFKKIKIETMLLKKNKNNIFLQTIVEFEI